MSALCIILFPDFCFVTIQWMQKCLYETVQNLFPLLKSLSYWVISCISFKSDYTSFNDRFLLMYSFPQIPSTCSKPNLNIRKNLSIHYVHHHKQNTPLNIFPTYRIMIWSRNTHLILVNSDLKFAIDLVGKHGVNDHLSTFVNRTK